MLRAQMQGVTRRTLAMLLLLAISAAPAAGIVAQEFKPADWPTYLHDTGRSGRQPVAGSMTTAPTITAAFDLGATPVGPIGFYDLNDDGAREGLFLRNG